MSNPYADERDKAIAELANALTKLVELLTKKVEEDIKRDQRRP